MMKFIEFVFWGIFAIFLIFSSILLAGFIQVVFYNWEPPAIYVGYLASVIGESIALLLMYVRNVAGLRNGIRNTQIFETNQKINDYMLDLISKGSSLDVVSGTLSWVSEDSRIKQKLIDRSKNGEVNIYMPKKNAIAEELERNGAIVRISQNLNKRQFARYTLVDRNNPGSCLLAVGCGVLPNFIISEFDANSNSQVVALAQDHLEML